jgi:carbonic anhydrase
LRLLDLRQRKGEWALSILTDYLGDKGRAADLHNDFAALTIRRFTADWELSGSDTDSARFDAIGAVYDVLPDWFSREIFRAIVPARGSFQLMLCLRRRERITQLLQLERRWCVSMSYLGGVAVKKLLGGISRFQKDVYPKHQDLFERLAMGQRPDALFITCADSRIDPCLLTQTKPGELFICRVIGNVVPPYPDAIGGVSATIEYAVGVLRVPEVIVCGHTDCGVMRGALNPEALEAYPAVAAWLRYANVERRELQPSAELLLALTEENVVAQLKNLRTHPSVAARLEEGDLALHGWVYHIGPGAVTAYDEGSGKFEATVSSS